MRNAPSLGSALAVALLAAGCGGGTSEPSGEQTTLLVNTGGPTVVTPGGSTGATSESELAPQALKVTAPADATETIFCRDFTGVDHVEAALRARDFAADADLPPQAAGALGNFYVVHGEDRSVLYHGFYKTSDPLVDKREADRALRDRRIIEAMEINSTAGDTVRAFPRTLFVGLQRPDPTAPSDWDLNNATGYWTVGIAAFSATPDRKARAVAAVREARKAGVDAYFFHDKNQSYVCVGLWPKSAARQTITGNYPDARDIDPNDPPGVMVFNHKAPEWAKSMRDRRGRPVYYQEIGLDVRDPELESVMREYDWDVNGINEAAEPLLYEIPKLTGKQTEITGEDRDDGPLADPLRKKDMNELLDRGGIGF